MNSYTWAVVFVACLAAGAIIAVEATGGFPSFVTSDDVDELNKYFNGKPRLNGTDGDLALIEQDAEVLEGGAKRAALAILALRDIKECNEDVLAFFSLVEASAMNRYDAGDRPRLVSHKLATKAGKVCANYVQKLVLDKHRQVVSSDQSVAKLYQVLKQRHEMFGYSILYSSGAVMENFAKLPLLRRLVPDNSGPIAGNRAKFERLFNELIVEPCKMYNYVLADAYKKGWLVANVYFNYAAFSKYTSVHYKDVMWAYDSCEQLSSIDSKHKTSMFQNMQI